MKVLQKFNLFFLLVIASSISTHSAATAVDSGQVGLASEADQLWAKIIQINEKTQNSLKTKTDVASLHQARSFFTASCDLKHPDNALAQMLTTQAQQLKSNLGISFRGGYTSDNLADKTGDPNAYLELSWDLWRQGYSGNNHLAKSLQSKAAIASLRAGVEQQKLNFLCRRYSFNQTFSGLLSHLLTLKLQLMEPVYNIEKRAYFKNWSHLDDLLVSEEDLHLLRQELSYLHSDPYRDASITTLNNLPIIDIDINALIKFVRNDTRHTKINSLEKQALSEKNAYRKNDRLRLFLRKQFDVGDSNDDGMVAGVRFSIPLEKNRRLAEQYKITHLDQQMELDTWEKVAKTRAAYQSFREQLHRTIKQQYRALRSSERLRRILVATKHNQDIQLASAASRLRSNLDANIELVRAKEELYRRVNKVFLIAGANNSDSYISLSSLREKTNRARSGERSIYLWSKGFNHYSNDTIFDFLQAKGINRVLLTAGRVVKREKMQQFIKTARGKNIHVESIVGPNKLFLKEHHQSAVIAVDAASTLSDGIHLDIEPHTFSEYKQNKIAYLAQYIEMLRTIREQSPNIKLSVAVPFHWPESTYASLNALVDHVYIMAYGSTKTDTILRRLQPAIKNIDSNKIVTVLRVTDFADEWALEQMITSLQQAGLNKFSLHTFRRFLQMAGGN